MTTHRHVHGVAGLGIVDRPQIFPYNNGLMGEWIYALLEPNPILVLFLILGLGLLAGRIKVFRVELGSVTGVLLIGLVIGHVGLRIPQASHNIGFILFIYCVGVQAGPQFMSVFRENGAKYILLAFLTAAVAIFLAWAASEVFGFELGMSAGLLAGALTSTPTLVAAQDAVAQGLQLPEGMSVERVLSNIGSAYAISYVFGLVSLILFISIIPRILRIDVAGDAKKLAEESGYSSDTGDIDTRPTETPTIRAYRVERDTVIGRTSKDLDYLLPFDIQRIKRDNEVFTPDDDMEIQLGDIVSVVALRRAHDIACERLGPEVIDYDVLDRSTESRKIMVTNSEIVGKTLSELDFRGTYQCWHTQLTRTGVDLPRRPDLKLQLGDELLLTGARSKLDELAEHLGYVESEIHQTDLVTFAFGIALGLFVGTFSLQLGQTVISLGSAGGVLLSGLLFGLLRSKNPTLGQLPSAARYVLMELGLLLFMATVAVNAGTTIVDTFLSVGPKIALCSISMTIVSVVISFFVGRYLLRMNAATLLGAITGSMTSTAALQQVNKLAGNSLPMLGYVGTYTFANVLLAAGGALVMRL